MSSSHAFYAYEFFGSKFRTYFCCMITSFSFKNCSHYASRPVDQSSFFVVHMYSFLLLLAHVIWYLESMDVNKFSVK